MYVMLSITKAKDIEKKSEGKGKNQGYIYISKDFPFYIYGYLLHLL
jgi:hypothetical protein